MCAHAHYVFKVDCMLKYSAGVGAEQASNEQAPIFLGVYSDKGCDGFEKVILLSILCRQTDLKSLCASIWHLSQT